MCWCCGNPLQVMSRSAAALLSVSLDDMLWRIVRRALFTERSCSKKALFDAAAVEMPGLVEKDGYVRGESASGDERAVRSPLLSRPVAAAWRTTAFKVDECARYVLDGSAPASDFLVSMPRFSLRVTEAIKKKLASERNMALLGGFMRSFATWRSFEDSFDAHGRGKGAPTALPTTAAQRSAEDAAQSEWIARAQAEFVENAPTLLHAVLCLGSLVTEAAVMSTLMFRTVDVTTATATSDDAVKTMESTPQLQPQQHDAAQSGGGGAAAKEVEKQAQTAVDAAVGDAGKAASAQPKSTSTTTPWNVGADVEWPRRKFRRGADTLRAPRGGGGGGGPAAGGNAAATNASTLACDDSVRKSRQGHDSAAGGSFVLLSLSFVSAVSFSFSLSFVSGPSSDSSHDDGSSTKTEIKRVLDAARIEAVLASMSRGGHGACCSHEGQGVGAAVAAWQLLNKLEVRVAPPSLFLSLSLADARARACAAGAFFSLSLALLPSSAHYSTARREARPQANRTRNGSLTREQRKRDARRGSRHPRDRRRRVPTV